MTSTMHGPASIPGNLAFPLTQLNDTQREQRIALENARYASELEAAITAHFNAGIIVTPADYNAMLSVWRQGGLLSDLE